MLTEHQDMEVAKGVSEGKQFLFVCLFFPLPYLPQVLHSSPPPKCDHTDPGFQRGRSGTRDWSPAVLSLKPETRNLLGPLFPPSFFLTSDLPLSCYVQKQSYKPVCC